MKTLRCAPLMFVFAVCILFLLTSVHVAAAPEEIQYQGRITQGGGLVSGNHTFIFELFTEAEEGVPLYSETQTVTVVDGIYSVSIGAVNTVPGALSSALTNPVVYLGVTVGGFVLLPRERIVSVAYALHADSAGTADTVSSLSGLPANSLVVGEDQLVTANGKVGIGTDDPQAMLHIGGTPGVDGIMFPDGTVQTTAATDLIPVGTMMPFAGGFVGGFAPQGYLLCDGREVSRTTYAYLFQVVGTSFGGGDGSTTFNVPDMRGRAAIGLNNMGGTPSGRITDDFADFVGGTGGSDTHVLTEDEMPAHNHGINDPGHAHAYNDNGGIVSVSSGSGNDVQLAAGSPSNTVSATTGITTANAGGGNAHNIMQPSIAMGWIIKATAAQPLNTPPIVNADAIGLIALNDLPVDLEGIVSDDGLPNPPGLTTTLWTKVSGPGTVSIGNSSSLNTTADFSTNGTYVLGLYAYDGFHVVLDAVTINVNQAPFVDPGAYATNLTLVENLDGSVSDEGLPNPPGVVTTLWEKVSGPGTVVFGDASAIDTPAAFSTSGVYQISLSAYDGQLFAVQTAMVSIAYTTPPDVDAGPDSYGSFLAATMAGVITDDGWVDPVTSVWEKVSGPGSVNFADASQGNTAATFSQPGNYTLSLTAYDGQLSATDDVSLIVYTGAVPSLVSLDFKLMGTFTNAGFSTNGVTLTPSQSVGVPGSLNVVTLSGLGVVGGVPDIFIDTNEGMMFDIIGTNNIEVSYIVGNVGNQNGNGTLGDAFVEAFDLSDSSLGIHPINGVGTVDVSALFGNVPISKFEVRADVDNHRIRDMQYRPGP